ncbi:MAG: NAD(P)H azoreductase [Candidatus Heimdallarchaeota archaeon LC_2]|nr:MAG: NAD(P)H azoreductase [Candidatus Heimdallarchaeota archaeon LC_2]
MSNKTILVFGATGNMGGSVIRAILGKGYDLRALVRDPHNTKSELLRKKGVNLVEGNFDDYQSMVSAAKGVNIVFIVTPVTPEEAKMGIAAINAVTEAGVKHIIFNSVSDSDNNTGIPHFDAKREAEIVLEQGNVPYTIVGPVFIMDNLISPWVLPQMKEGNFVQPMSGVTQLQVISFQDVGKFVSLIIEKPEKFLNKRIDIAGDSLTSIEMSSYVSLASRKDIKYVQSPSDTYPEDLQKMYSWFENVGYSVDLNELYQKYPEVKWTSFKDWTKMHDLAGLLSN